MCSIVTRLIGTLITIGVIHFTAAANQAASRSDSLRAEIVELLASADSLIAINSLRTLDSALLLLDSAESLVRTYFGDRDSLLAITLYDEARSYHSLSDYDRAVSLVNQAMNIWESISGDNRIHILKNLNRLTEASLQKHDLAQCEQICLRRLEILDSLGTPLSEDEREQWVEALNDIGRLRVLQNRREEGMTAFHQALDLITENMEEGPRLRAALTGNIGWLLSEGGEYVEGEKYIYEALDQIRKAYHPEHPLVWTAYIFLSNIALVQQDYVRAASFLDSALSLAVNVLGDSNPSLSSFFLPKAKLFVALNRRDSALYYSLRAVRVNKAVSEYPTDRLMGSLETAGNIALIFKDVEMADALFRELNTIRHTFLSSVFSYASESQKLAYLDKYPAIQPCLLSAIASNSNPAMTRVALDMVLGGKGLAIDALTSDQASAICSDDATLDSLLEGYRETCSEIARLALSSHSNDEDAARKLHGLYSQKDRLEMELSLRCSGLDFNRWTESVSASMVASTLPDNSVLWEFVKYPRVDLNELYRGNPDKGEYYAVMTLDPDDRVSFVDLGPAHAIDSLVQQYQSIMSDAMREQITDDTAASNGKYHDISLALYRYLVTPLENTMQDEVEIIVSADGALNLLPFETLTKDGQRYLIEDHQFVYLTSGRDVLNESPGADGRDAIIMADPDFMSDPSALPSLAVTQPSPLAGVRGNTDTPECLGSMFSPLPATHAEGSSVAQRLRESTNLDVSFLESDRAREGTLKHLQQAPRILHIATHGYFCERVEETLMSNPLLRSGLLLAGANRTIGQLSREQSGSEDGILTALEVSGLNLVGTDLVVLSACQTGLGEVLNGEGVFGLRRAFQLAGAQSLIMSMFAVPDESTATIMERFYDNWLSGDSKSVALRNASLSMLAERRENGQSTHPLFWGGFIFAGNPN